MASKTKPLTEAEVLKMPKSEYMNAAQLRFFREQLLELQRQLRENAGATTEHLRELSFAPDPADRATLEEEHALELRTRDRERKLLKKIDGALARIEDGSYGFCEETGEPIGDAFHRGPGAARDEAEALRRIASAIPAAKGCPLAPFFFCCANL
jgi:DnaK suppressor protein